MTDNNSNNRNVYDLDAMGLRPLHRIYRERSEPSFTSPPAPSSGEVSERIDALQSELVAYTCELGDMRAKYNRALIEVAHAVREIAELQAQLSTQRQQYLASQASSDRMTEIFKEYRQRYWPGRPQC